MDQLIIDFEGLAEGAVKEKIETELKRIAENVLDLNTDYKKTRMLNIKIKFLPNERRSEMSTSIEVTSKLAPAEESATTFLIGQDYTTGAMAINEIKSGQQGQMFIDPEDGKLKTDIGEDADEVEAKENNSIIDYNSRKTN